MWKSEPERGQAPRRELLRKVGDAWQLGGARSVILDSGRARGTRAVEVRNAAGLSCTLLADKCLDILDLRWKGANIGFISKNGSVGNHYFNPHGEEFGRYWTAGMLSTCGLGNTGPACDDGGIHYPEHGRIGMTPAEEARVESGWKGDRFEIEVAGTMRESAVCGPSLALQRRVRTELHSREIAISDLVINEEPLSEEFMLLYHFNFGWPLLDADSRLLAPADGARPRTPEAAAGLERRLSFSEPVDGSGEECYFYDCRSDAEGFAWAALINDRLGLGAYVGWNKESLPVLTQWKNPRSHDYTMGLEPGNSYIMGRKLERENGTLRSIPGYGHVACELRLGILDGAAEIARFEEYLGALGPRRP